MIDLHTHTTLSDGTSSPAELLEEARHVGLKALAITDHDTLAGFDAAYPLAEKHNVELVCGIELSTQFQHPQEPKLAVHLLGYFPDRLPDDEFRGWVTSISSTRRERNLKLMEKLQSSNISISWKDFPISILTVLPAHISPVYLWPKGMFRISKPRLTSFWTIRLSQELRPGFLPLRKQLKKSRRMGASRL